MAVEGSQWESVSGPSGLYGRRVFAFVTYGDYIYAIGGAYWYRGDKRRSRVDRYDIATNTWARMGDFHMGTQHAGPEVFHNYWPPAPL